MSAPAAAPGRLELADIVREHAGDLEGLTPGQRKILRAIAACRTAALGGHLHQCDHCGHQEISYNSCRDRHCPKCQRLDEARWRDAQQNDLLPVPYFHVVFTVPAVLHDLFLASSRVAYTLLFAAVAETLEEVARRRLGAKIGFVAVLHTWTQLLLFHPHIHCIVPGGGLNPEETQWISTKPDFFLPVRVLSEVFRGKLLSKLENALDGGKIHAGHEHRPRDPLERAARQNWVVYCKPPFAGPEPVLAYLGRYAHRVAISNERLISMQEGNVTFRWKDRQQGNAPRVATLNAEAFLRRFLLHVLPRGFMRIRHYGFLANSVRHKKLGQVRQLLDPSAGPPPGPPPQALEPWPALLLRLTGKDVTRCPRCGQGRLRIVQRLPAASRPSITSAPVRSP